MPNYSKYYIKKIIIQTYVIFVHQILIIKMK